jgi:chromosome segregation ATPase
MLEKRIQAINGKGKMTLAQMAKRPPEAQMESDYAKLIITDKLLELASENANKSAWEDAKAIIEALEEKLEAAEESKNTESGLFGEIKLQLEAQNTSLKESIASLTAEIKSLKDNEISKDIDHDMSLGIQKGLLRDVEIKLADALGRLDQANKQIKELKESAKQIPMPLVVEKPIPSFNFKPVKDRAGNIVEVIATPVGG